jgi:hypothetical protein
VKSVAIGEGAWDGFSIVYAERKGGGGQAETKSWSEAAVSLLDYKEQGHDVQSRTRFADGLRWMAEWSLGWGIFRLS